MIFHRTTPPSLYTPALQGKFKINQKFNSKNIVLCCTDAKFRLQFLQFLQTEFWHQIKGSTKPVSRLPIFEYIIVLLDLIQGLDGRNIQSNLRIN